MTAREAYIKLQDKVTGVRVTKCHEYDSVFVFQINPVALYLSKNSARILDGSMSVDKLSGAVRDFKPYNLSINEYKRGKEVPESAYRR